MNEKREMHEFFEERLPLDGRITGGGGFSFAPRWRFWVVVALLFVLVVIWPAWASFHSDLLWYQELGYVRVFSTLLTAKLVAGIIGFSIGAAAFYVNVRIAQSLSRNAGASGYRINVGGQEVAIADAGRLIGRLAPLISALVGLLFGAKCWNAWELWLPFHYGQRFGQSDPILGFDISFYFFGLPWYDFASGAVQLLTVFLLISAALVYVGRAAITFAPGKALTVLSGPRKHLLILAGIGFLTLAFRDFLDIPDGLLSGSANVAGAGYADVHAGIPLMWAKAGIAALIGLVFLLGTLFGKLRIVFAGLALYVATIVISFIYPAMVQRFSVAPNELEKEGPYIANSIAATRKAFGLDRVEEKELSENVPLTGKDIQESRQTINSIRLWDQEPLLSTFAQLQEIRPYYEFQGVDNDRYVVNGELQQVMLSVRELESGKLPNRNWINERFVFTHGIGLTLGSVNRVTPEGLPELYIKDIPPVSSLPALKVTRPEIYFGEMQNGPAYVRTRQLEFNYPEGENNQFSKYEGTGGVSIGSYYRKLLFATRFGDLKLMLSNDITSESRVLFIRSIKERLQLIAPFLVFDRDPYPVIADGRIIWICDAYTVSNRYPYSHSVSFGDSGQVNYIRNSVKAVVDAYDGSASLYVSDRDDPLIATYDRIFPGVLKPMSEMPTALRSHLRYPEDIFRIQTYVYSTYHMDQPQVFYNKEDQWEIASASEGANGPVPMDPYYTIMRLPSGRDEEFLVMIPFVPKNKLNLAAWMVARCDGENYGKLLVYRLPKQRQVFGPKQIMGRINQDAEISGQLTLWNQRGSRVSFGTMLLIPIKESMIYVLPLYLQAETGKIPELKRVIVVNENRIAMGSNLDESLAKIFGGQAVEATQAAAATGAVQVPSAPQVPAAALSTAREALEHDDQAMKALKEGDWARYGEERRKVRALLEKLNREGK